jgi:hypothetical protein
MTNMDEYNTGSPTSVSTPTPFTLHDRIHESLAYDCYVKPDNFLRKLDSAYQPFHQDGVGVLRNTAAWY